MVQGHDPKVRNLFIVHPHRLGWIRTNFENSISFSLNNTSACRKYFFPIKIGLWQRDITVVEGNPLFPLRENSGKLSIMLRIENLNLHHFNFIPTPELLLSGPLVSCCPPCFLERVEEIQKIAFLSLSIESRPERIFESAKPSVLALDP